MPPRRVRLSMPRVTSVEVPSAATSLQLRRHGRDGRGRRDSAARTIALPAISRPSRVEVPASASRRRRAAGRAAGRRAGARRTRSTRRCRRPASRRTAAARRAACSTHVVRGDGHESARHTPGTMSRSGSGRCESLDVPDAARARRRRRCRCRAASGPTSAPSRAPRSMRGPGQRRRRRRVRPRAGQQPARHARLAPASPSCGRCCCGSRPPSRRRSSSGTRCGRSAGRTEPCRQ